MARNGWLIAGACVALAACGQPAGDAAQAAADDEILPATESYKVFGDYVVHFNAVPTVDLSPEIADEYDIIRSNNRILLNVSMLRSAEIGFGTAVTGTVEATAANLTGQLRTLLTQEITEGEAIYYIAETQIEDGETLIFTIDATPDGLTEPLRVRFQKRFFVDE